MKESQEKVKFVNDLCNSIRDQVIDQILVGRIPEEWNGHELRRFLSEKFDEVANVSSAFITGKRLKDYKNTVIINNL